MKTDGLIRALVTDLPSAPESVGSAAMKRLPIGLAIAAMLFFALAGIRPNFSAMWPVVLPKLLVTMTLAATAIFVAMHLTRPGGARPRLLFLLLAPLVVLSIFMLLEFWRYGGVGWGARIMGRNNLYCLLMIPVLSIAPLLALLLTAQCGAVTTHYLAGGVAGMAATGFGASLYALHCTDDSMFFVALWYSLATLIMAAIGSVACRLTVRW